MEGIMRITGAWIATGALILSVNLPQKEQPVRTPTPTEEANVLAAETVTEKPWHVIEGIQVYHYCPCRKCCGKDENHPAYKVTKSGAIAEEGRTIAVDPELIPLGAEVVVNGKTYIAEDTGVKGYKVDIYMEDHYAALAAGTYEATLKWR